MQYPGYAGTDPALIMTTYGPPARRPELGTRRAARGGGRQHAGIGIVVAQCQGSAREELRGHPGDCDCYRGAYRPVSRLDGRGKLDAEAAAGDFLAIHHREDLVQLPEVLGSNIASRDRSLSVGADPAQHLPLTDEVPRLVGYRLGAGFHSVGALPGGPLQLYLLARRQPLAAQGEGRAHRPGFRRGA